MARPRTLWNASLTLFFLLLFVLTPNQARCQTNTLGVSPASIFYGTVAVGSSANKSESVTNGFSSRIVLTEITFNASGFSKVLYLPLTLGSGQSATFSVVFTPTSVASYSATMKVKYKRYSNRHWNYGSSSVALQGTGTGAAGSLTVTPSSMSFGNVTVGNQQVLPLTLTNGTGQSATIQVSQIATSGTGFAASGVNPPVTLGVGQSVTLNVTFRPPTGGADNGSVAITSNAANPNVSVPLSGTGVANGQLTVNPGSLNFGNVTVGNSASLSGSLTVTSGSVTVSSASWNGAGFTLGGVSFPVVIGAGQSLPFAVTFAPQSAGSVNGTVAFASNASNGAVSEPLTGTGTAPQQHSVALTWNPDSGSVQGYYVYRGSQSGGPYGKISPLESSPAFTDGAVTSGQTYFYVVTALGTNSVESGYSNEVMAAIP